MRAIVRIAAIAWLSLQAAQAQPPGFEAAEGTIFGQKLQAKKLGVMIDVSGSTHPYLLGVLTEVERSFPGAPIVLLFGCGAKAAIKPDDFQIRPAAQAQAEYEQTLRLMQGDLPLRDKKILEESVFGQVAKASLNPAAPGLGKHIDRLLQKPGIYWSIASREVNPRFGSALAMEFLAEQGVDTIYWFSDCNDAFELAAAEAVAAKLNAKGVRLSARNFTGNDDPRVNPGVVATIKITEATGGQYLSMKIPGK